MTLGVDSSARAVPGSGNYLEGSWHIWWEWISDMGMEETAQSLATFTQDGGIVETRKQAFGISNGHGAWISWGNRNFEGKIVNFLYDDLGEFVGSTETRIWLRLNSSGKWFNGRFRLFHKDAKGMDLGSFDGLLEASRITVN
jgi:hypothetical protein